MGITEILVEYIPMIIGKIGYVSIFVLMTMESMIFPIPSEAVMPFAGFLVADGRFNLLATIIIAVLGSTFGAFLSYYIGYYGGHRFINKYGKYFLIDDEGITWIEKLFKKKGQIIIFFGRMIPVVRHIISIPAGIAKMEMKNFLFWTILGAIIRNSFLTFVGVYLQKRRDTLMRYIEFFDIVIIAIILIFIVMLVYKIIKRNLKTKKDTQINTN